ncbi:MAG: hypothetical protein LBD72_02540 [Puniceicoccales bacterium]|nr:hypothetical protein [Puniceicoccales bacterium]
MKTSGFFDALSKAIHGEIEWKDFFSCFAGLKFEKTFADTFQSQAGIYAKLDPLLYKLKEEVNQGHVNSAQLYTILSAKDSNNVTIAMISCLTQQGVNIITELVDKLSADDQRALLDSNAAQGLNLYNYIARNIGDGNKMQEDGVLAKVTQMYEKYYIQTDSRPANAILGKRVEEEEVNFLANAGTGPREIDMEAVQRNQVTQLSRIVADVLPGPGQKMTAKQVDEFKHWLSKMSPYNNLIGNLDGFIAAFGGDDLAQNNIQKLCGALFDYDNGATLKEILLEYDTEDESMLGMAAYAKQVCFSDEICEKLFGLYEKCGLGDKINEVRERPNIGPAMPVNTHLRTVTNISIPGTPAPGIKQVMCCDSTGKKGAATLANIRQLAQCEHMEHVSITTIARNITIEDLTHLFREAKNLKKITLKGNASSIAPNVTAEMIKEALTRSGRNDIAYGYQSAVEWRKKP